MAKLLKEMVKMANVVSVDERHFSQVLDNVNDLISELESFRDSHSEEFEEDDDGNMVQTINKLEMTKFFDSLAKTVQNTKKKIESFR